MCSFEHEMGYRARMSMCAGNSLALVGVSLQSVVSLHIRLFSGFSSPLIFLPMPCARCRPTHTCL